MNNSIIFALGTLTGAAAGSVATYFVLRDKFEQRAAEEIEAYAQHAEERLQNYISSHYDVDDLDDPGEESEPQITKSTDVPVNDDSAISQNPGVKKYHHYQSGFMPEEDKNVTKGQEDILKRPQLESIAGIEEDITEDEFDALSDDEYTKVYLQYDANEDKLFTNEGEIAEEAYAKMRHELIGNCWRWSTDYVDKGGMFFVQNDNLKIAFAVEVLFDPEAPMVEVG